MASYRVQHCHLLVCRGAHQQWQPAVKSDGRNPSSMLVAEALRRPHRRTADVPVPHIFDVIVAQKQ